MSLTVTVTDCKVQFAAPDPAPLALDPGGYVTGEDERLDPQRISPIPLPREAVVDAIIAGAAKRTPVVFQ